MKDRLKALFILDPLSRLDPVTDTSLALVAEFQLRGYETWAADTPDLSVSEKGVRVIARKFAAGKAGKFSLQRREKTLPLKNFALTLLRKEPPFDESYLAMTYILEAGQNHSTLSNAPLGIRNTNEKMGIFHFPQWIPKTISTSSPAAILSFQQKLQRKLVIKPLDQKGGKGIFILSHRAPESKAKLFRASRGGKKPLQAQEFLSGSEVSGEKRILILGGKLLGAYEKIPKKGEFRANLSLGGTIRKTSLTPRERRLTADVAHYARRQGLHLVGIDVLQEKLIEINVTCPSGLLDLKLLEPELEPIKAWADFLEKRVSKASPR